MLAVRKLDHIEKPNKLKQLKQQYLEQSTAPLDGMWLCGFIPMAEHYGFYEEEILVGYCCVNNDGYLLQFYLAPCCNTLASDLFALIVEQQSSPISEIKGAFVSTAEPQFLSFCFDTFSKFQVNALMFQTRRQDRQEQKERLPMTVAASAQLQNFVEFAKENIGAPEPWLNDYYGNLINRQELFGYWHQEKLLAAGECRYRDDYQTDYADLGIIIAKSERGKGMASQALNFLVDLVDKKGKKPILSTENSNIAAQKAIHRAGFNDDHRIIQFDC